MAIFSGLDVNDFHIGTADADTLAGNGGDDNLNGAGGNDLVTGGLGFDTLFGGDGADTIEGGDQADKLYGMNGDDRLDGGGDGFGDDLSGGLGADTLIGGDGDDSLIVEVSATSNAGDTVAGGAGTVDRFVIVADTPTRVVRYADYTVSGVEWLIMPQGELAIDHATLTAFDRTELDTVRLTDHGALDALFQGVRARQVILNDVGRAVDLIDAPNFFFGLTGGAGSDTLTGGARGDTLSGGAGDDIVRGGPDDPLRGGVSDTLGGGAGVDHVDGQGGDDTLRVEEGEAVVAGDRYTGGAGVDTLFIAGGTFGSTVVYTDLTAATFDADIEALSGNDLAGAVLTRAQLAGFADARLAVRLADAGAVNLANTRIGLLTLNPGGNAVTLGEDPTNNFFTTNRVEGGAGNDTVIGTRATDSLRGGAGNDLLEGMGGDDDLFGGDGDDTVRGGEGNESFFDSAGNDLIEGGPGDDRFMVGVFQPVSAGDRFVGGDGIDTLEIFSQGAIDLAGIDFTGIEALSAGGAVAMTVPQLTQFQTINAQAITVTTAGAFALTGGPLAARTVTLSALGNAVDMRGYGEFSPVTITGGAAGDTIRGGQSSDQLNGGGGIDVIAGEGGGDFINGGAGADSLYGGLGDDRYFVDPTDIVFEGEGGGSDTVVASGSVYLYAHVDALEFVAGNAAFFGVGNAQANSLAGTLGANLLLGGAGDDTLLGDGTMFGFQGGNDQLFGEAGDDSLVGMAGIDYLAGGDGADRADGGEAADAIYGEAGDDLLDGGSGFFTDILVGGAGDDSLFGASGFEDYDLMDGGAGDDIYIVDTSADLTFEAAGGGIDTVRAEVDGGGVDLYAHVENLILGDGTLFGVGNELANYILGGRDNNLLIGGAGADTLDGGGETDLLYGQAGADVFQFRRGTGGDVIADFAPGTDDIDLRALGFTSFAQAQANMTQNAGSTAINFGAGDFVVILGVTNAQLSAGDFLFG